MAQYIRYPATFSGVLPAALGQTTMANSLPVVIASDQSAIPVTIAGLTSVALINNVYATTNVTNAAYVQLVASTSAAIKKIHIFDSSGALLKLAVGAAASEVDKVYVFPGGVPAVVDIAIASGSRLSIKSVDTATVNTGQLAITALG